MKIRKCLIALGVFLLVISLIFINKKEETLDSIGKNVNREKLSMMLQNEAGNYEEVTRSEWPTEGYMFNETLSFCENGGELSWDSEKKIVVMDSDISDKCYIYFDMDNRVNLTEYIKSKYTGVQGENNLYLHDDTLENGAGDGSYRYAGASDVTNNFVCFGYDSKKGECPSDNLYRIIGVFGDNVKLVKWDYATYDLLGKDGDYASNYKAVDTNGVSKGINLLEAIGSYNWNGTSSAYMRRPWSTSQLNIENLNANFLHNIGTDWTLKIITTPWKIGGNNWDRISEKTANEVYVNEIISPYSTAAYNTRIGLIYVSDYLYAASPDYWLYKSYASDRIDYRVAIDDNWMHMGLYEWTITNSSPNSSGEAIILYPIGHIYYYTAISGKFAVRPTFYLESTVNYVSGNGTMEMPYIID